MSRKEYIYLISAQGKVVEDSGIHGTSQKAVKRKTNQGNNKQIIHFKKPTRFTDLFSKSKKMDKYMDLAIITWQIMTLPVTYFRSEHAFDLWRGPIRGLIEFVFFIFHTFQ